MAFGTIRNSIKLSCQSLSEADFNSFNLGDTHNPMKDGGWLGNVRYIRLLNNSSYLSKETEEGMPSYLCKYLGESRDCVLACPEEF